MKLFFSPGACSLAPHIVLHESGLKFSSEKVDLRNKTYAGGDFLKVCPKGQVPALQLNDGGILTECAVILQYISDQIQSKNLMPQPKTLERYQCLEWINFIATELHKTLALLWGNPPEEYRAKILQKLSNKFDYVTQHLKTHEFMMGNKFGAADAYLFTMISWCVPLKIEMVRWPGLMDFVERAKARPSVQAAMKAEGLIKA